MKFHPPAVRAKLAERPVKPQDGKSDDHERRQNQIADTTASQFDQPFRSPVIRLRVKAERIDRRTFRCLLEKR